MQQQVELLSEDDIQRLGHQLGFCRALLEEVAPGEAFDNSIGDLARLQLIIDSGRLKPEDTAELQALGVPFGQMFVHVHPSFNWWMVIDELGRDPCIRYGETDLLIYPLTLISKRVEAGKTVDVINLYETLVGQLESALTDLQQPSDAEPAPATEEKGS